MQMVFSSSCTVYGDVQKEHVPIKESTPLAAMSPYGRTKLMIEDIFRDVAKSDPEWRIILLRYFNPVGAHPSGEIGEHPIGIPNNLMPYIQQVGPACDGSHTFVMLLMMAQHSIIPAAPQALCGCCSV